MLRDFLPDREELHKACIDFIAGAMWAAVLVLILAVLLSACASQQPCMFERWLVDPECR